MTNWLISFQRQTRNSCPGGPCVIRPFDFQPKLKIENRCQCLILLYFLSGEIYKRISINISPFSRV